MLLVTKMDFKAMTRRRQRWKSRTSYTIKNLGEINQSMGAFECVSLKIKIWRIFFTRNCCFRLFFLNKDVDHIKCIWSTKLIDILSFKRGCLCYKSFSRYKPSYCSSNVVHQLTQFFQMYTTTLQHLHTSLPGIVEL